MNKAKLKRAMSIAEQGYGAAVRRYPYKKEIFVAPNGSMSIHPVYGYVNKVIQPPTENNYGLFEVAWAYLPEYGTVFGPYLETVSGDSICYDV